MHQSRLKKQNATVRSKERKKWKNLQERKTKSLKFPDDPTRNRPTRRNAQLTSDPEEKKKVDAFRGHRHRQYEQSVHFPIPSYRA